MKYLAAFIALDLTARDSLHEAWHGRHLWRNMLMLILCGSLLSALMNASAMLIPPPRPQPLHTVSALISPLQNGLPFCRKCGRVHDRNHWGRYADLCQSCDDQQALESLWARRAIFAGDDPETVLDRLFAAFPSLFERGILPDAWFVLMRTGV